MTRTPFPLQSLLESLKHANIRHQFFPVQPHPKRALSVVVGVSGGADSVCLLHLLHALQNEWHLELHVAHFDHATRASSTGDAEFVRQLANQLGLPFHLEKAVLHKAPDSRERERDLTISEATLRTLRYRFLCRIARSVEPTDQVPTILLAHHADDQAETVLFRLIRGAGVDGLSGMQHVTRRFDPDLQEYVRIIRPLLDVRRSEIIRYLGEAKISWHEDPSNRSFDYARNRIRHQIMPALEAVNPYAVEAIVRTAKLIQESAKRLERLDRQQVEALRIGTVDQARVVFDLRKLQALDERAQRAVLRLALLDLLETQPTLLEVSYEQIETLRQQLETQQSASGAHPIVGNLAWSVVATTNKPSLLLSLHRANVLPLLPNYPSLPGAFISIPLTPETALKIGDWQLQIKQISCAALPNNWRQNPDPWQAFVDADKTQNPLLDSASSEMRIAPLGMGGKSKSLGDFFTDCKIHPSERESWPLIVDKVSGEIVWVCGLAIAHAVRITEETNKVWWLRWVKFE